MNLSTQQNVLEQEINKPNGRENHNKKHVAHHDEIADLNRQSKKIQDLVEEIDSLADSRARGLMQECVQEFLGFYGNGLKRILGIISKGNTSASKDIYNNLIDDSFVSGLLLIHDLHPLDLNTRLHIALDNVKPYMDSHGGDVEIISLIDGVARLKLSGHCKGCPSSASTLELGIKKEIEENCPDLLDLEVEGVVAPANHSEEGKQVSSQGWKTIDDVVHLKNGEMKSVDSSGTSLVICRVKGKLYAYRNLCAACGVSLSDAKLEESEVSCKLGHRFDVKLAGKCTDDADIHLDPFPLLEINNIVKVAVSA